MGYWQKRIPSYADTTVLNCDFCGRMIPRDVWIVEKEKKILRFCGPECEKKMNEYRQKKAIASEGVKEMNSGQEQKYFVKTPFRCIKNTVPCEESQELLGYLYENEPRSMHGQPQVLWHKADGYNVYDIAGNKWLDFSSGILVVNVGHNRPEVQKAVNNQMATGVTHTYVFPNEPRARLVKLLNDIVPPYFDAIFLLTTGSEAVENIIKVMRSWGIKNGGMKKIGVVSFDGAFHGRTLGAQMAGGIPSLKRWIVNFDPDIFQVPFPDCYECPCGKMEYAECEEECFDLFLRSINEKIKGEKAADRIAGIIAEPYRGGTVDFFPDRYVQMLWKWCKENNILLAFDEIQSGFGRTGKMFAHEYYNVQCDLMSCGKAISGGLPLSAVCSTKEIMNEFPPGEMTSTHSGNPVCCTAAIANLQILLKERLVENAAKVGLVFHNELKKLAEENKNVIMSVRGRGMVYGIHIGDPGTMQPSKNLAVSIVHNAVRLGLLLISPIGPNGNVLKICPPLILTEDAVKDGVAALDEAIKLAVKGKVL